jgi:hypothetical protein
VGSELDTLIKRQRAVATKFSEIWMDEVLGAAQRIVPLEEGTLAGSADRETIQHADGVEVIGYFATVYARNQHNNTTYRHPNGRQAFYLETPFKQKAASYDTGLARALKATL